MLIENTLHWSERCWRCAADSFKSCQPDPYTRRSTAYRRSVEARKQLPAGGMDGNADGNPVHNPSAPPRPSIAARAVWSEVCPYTSPVIATEECPSRSATALMCTPDSSHATAAECRSVCTPTPSAPTVWAAASITRSRFARVDWPAQLGREYQTAVGPLVAGEQPFGLLLGSVLAQHRHDACVQRHGAP
jgi:hypothetical protein